MHLLYFWTNEMYGVVVNYVCMSNFQLCYDIDVVPQPTCNSAQLIDFPHGLRVTHTQCHALYNNIIYWVQ